MRVQLPVVLDASTLTPAETDLGYEVTLSRMQLALRDLVFTVAGEAHAARGNLLLSTAWAHPGHYQGGDVTGELPGAWVIDLPAEHERELGTATLLAGEYSAANFAFDVGAAGGPLAGHTAILEGSAARGDETIPFRIVIDAPDARELVGAPFAANVGPASIGPIRLRFSVGDVLENDTLLDGVDFAAMPRDADGNVTIEADEPSVADAYNAVRRAFLSHDHYSLALTE